MAAVGPEQHDDATTAVEPAAQVTISLKVMIKH